MKRPLQSALIALTLAALPVGFAQDAERQKKRDRPGEPLFSMPITQKLVENFMTRAVEKMAERYDLDDEQFEMADEILKMRVVSFIRENRAPMQRLFAEFSEVQSGTEPPEIDFVTEWAQRAMPLMEKARDEMGTIVGDMRDFMTEDQQLQLDGEWAAFNMGFKMLSGKVGGWADGGWDPQVDWVGNFDERRKRGREERRERHLAMREAEAQFLAEHGLGTQSDEKNRGKVATPRVPDNDAWTVEVEAFCARYELNIEQRTNAFRSLHKYRTRRDAYLIKSSTKRKMVAVGEALADAKTDQEKSAAREQLAAIDKPVERYHQGLRDALDTLPTRAQRAKAGKRDLNKKRAASPGDDATKFADGTPPE
ncbi:MAG: hypothetical protein IID33_00235 [Planctomycetes bacterium]|nr:hypothetical protein [Planctomycetota bacterium]